jgi:hypothetical protein
MFDVYVTFAPGARPTTSDEPNMFRMTHLPRTGDIIMIRGYNHSKGECLYKVIQRFFEVKNIDSLCRSTVTLDMHVSSEL